MPIEAISYPYNDTYHYSILIHVNYVHVFENVKLQHQLSPSICTVLCCLKIHDMILVLVTRHILVKAVRRIIQSNNGPPWVNEYCGSFSGFFCPQVIAQNTEPLIAPHGQTSTLLASSLLCVSVYVNG